ncbi:hinge domain of cleavage stimulation factor subunit 2-domain-containing protein [Mrakia frigida]|uniref:hinge domain of cleavage stimulation factor subunit 2-domain-containing protein n=1 Tax=Mrakia frigida TaxID=29902 RepID=UPI003FCC05FD
MPPRPSIKGVRVSHVPHDMTEEQLAHIMGEAGPVQKTRLVFHADTGRALGFGFVDFYHSETAASAVRNLNGTLIGGRPLTVAFQDGIESAAFRPTGQDSNNVDPIQALLNNPPRGKQPERGVNSTDAISQTLAAIPPGQLEEVLGRMKAMVMSHPAEAKELLNKNPQLGYALFQSMLMMNLVDPSVIQRMMAASTTSAPAPTPQPQPPYQQQPPQTYPPSRPAPPPPTYPQQPPQSYAPPPAPAPTPPPQTQPGPSDVPAAIRHLPAEQQLQIMAVLRMPQSQVDMLPADQRAQIMQLRTTIGAIA